MRQFQKSSFKHAETALFKSCQLCFENRLWTKTLLMGTMCNSKGNTAFGIFPSITIAVTEIF